MTGANRTAANTLVAWLPHGGVGRASRARRPAAKTVASAIGRRRNLSSCEKRVRQARARLGITQAELAKRIGSRQPAMTRLEAGGSVPSL
jgi:DNA-binding XRE family transcriptional regulator